MGTEQRMEKRTSFLDHAFHIFKFSPRIFQSGGGGPWLHGWSLVGDHFSSHILKRGKVQRTCSMVLLTLLSSFSTKCCMRISWPRSAKNCHRNSLTEKKSAHWCADGRPQILRSIATAVASRERVLEEIAFYVEGFCFMRIMEGSTVVFQVLSLVWLVGFQVKVGYKLTAEWCRKNVVFGLDSCCW